jgi:putative ATP-dependent endonuclease of the OLD family
LPWPSVIASVKLAQDLLSFPAYDQVRSRFLADLDKDISQWIESPKLRTDIGFAAKKAGWFKDTTRGDLWFKTLIPAFASADFAKKDIAVKLGKIWTWTENV